MKKISSYILLSLSVIFSQAQVNYTGTAVSAEVINNNVLNTTINVPASAFSTNLIAVAVTEYRHSFPVTVTDVYSQKSFKLGKSVITKNGSLLAIYYLADASNGTHKIKVSTGIGNNTNIQTVTTAYTGVDLYAPVAYSNSNSNSVAGNQPLLDINCSTDQMVVDAMIFEKAINPEAAPLPGSNLSYVDQNTYDLETAANTSTTGKLNLSWNYSKEPAGYWAALALTLQPTKYAIVPGQLINFSGKAENDVVELSWITTFENNLSYITVMRSSDNKEWKEVIRLTITGNSPVQKQYDVIDKNVGNGMYYYKLIFISGDGKKANSPIVTVKSAAENKLRFANMQNPFINELHVSLYTTSDEIVLVNLINSKGIIVASTTAKPSSGSVDFNFAGSAALKPGIYFLQCINQGEMISKTMLKS